MGESIAAKAARLNDDMEHLAQSVLDLKAELTRLRAVAEAADAYFSQKAWGTVGDVMAALRAWKEPQ